MAPTSSIAGKAADLMMLNRLFPTLTGPAVFICFVIAMAVLARDSAIGPAVVAVGLALSVALITPDRHRGIVAALSLGTLAVVSSIFFTSSNGDLTFGAISIPSTAILLTWVRRFSKGDSIPRTDLLAALLTTPPVPTLSQVSTSCEREIRRARRLELSAALLSLDLRRSLKPNGPAYAHVVDPDIQLELDISRAADVLSGRTKEFDVFFRHEGLLFAFLPHEDRAGAKLAARRFAALLEPKLELVPAIRVAAFPDDEISFPQLVEAVSVSSPSDARIAIVPPSLDCDLASASEST